MSIAIKVENLSKAYQIGQIGTGTISQDLERWWITRVLGKEDPFLKIGEVNDRTTKGESDVVWSLRDINFDIQQGDAVGIIGRNGAGKSTLLKILSEVTSPTTGKIKIKGRVASLLEVGTGFHPELSGRENIFLNGAILGMRKKEIARKLDEIIDFSGVERYIDTPVKRYSSGMYVRLAFAVAAHLESEILIVDEVLAVGDGEFQKKCLGKMGEVSKGEGRTVLFVSHSMSAVETLCNSAMVIENGTRKFMGTVDASINYYLKSGQIKPTRIIEQINYCHPDILITSIKINGSENNIIQVDEFNSNICISFRGKLKSDKNIAVGLTLFDMRNVKLAVFSPGHLTGKVERFERGLFEINENIHLPGNITKGIFRIDIVLHQPNIEMYLQIVNSIQLVSKGIIGATGLEFDYSDNGFLML